MNNNSHSLCPVWMAYTFDNALRRIIHPPQKLLGSYIQPGMQVADIGCGLGHFSRGIATLLQGEGRLFAIDLQAGMLQGMMRRMRKAGLDALVTPIQCTSQDICLPEQLDFALCAWMLHETPDVASTLRQIHASLRSGGMLCIFEPRMHVPYTEVQRVKHLADELGFRLLDEPAVPLSWGVVLQKIR
jgi:ubiquinone/menaquinone biosynthesis C-methylase UbiE